MKRRSVLSTQQLYLGSLLSQLVLEWGLQTWTGLREES